jgi:hypothetical protein
VAAPHEDPINLCSPSPGWTDWTDWTGPKQRRKKFQLWFSASRRGSLEASVERPSLSPRSLRKVELVNVSGNVVVVVVEAVDG